MDANATQQLRTSPNNNLVNDDRTLLAIHNYMVI